MHEPSSGTGERAIAALMGGWQDCMAIRAGELVLDLAHHFVSDGGRTVRLAPREFGLLAHLARRRGQVVGRAELLRAVWRLGIDPGTNLVAVHVSRIRARLGAELIETIHGRGYRLAR